MNSTNANQTHPPLKPQDDGVIAQLRAQVAPVKGKLDGPHARPVFDEVMEQTPEARGVTHDEGVVGRRPAFSAQCTAAPLAGSQVHTPLT
ncbi:MAG: hypothetical protein ABSC94_27535 [Polyangiaceae bacterium]|jgi:hypothetical protein